MKREKRGLVTLYDATSGIDGEMALLSIEDRGRGRWGQMIPLYSVFAFCFLLALLGVMALHSRDLRMDTAKRSEERRVGKECPV